jgi:predicted RecA/RadA family phage recombinase
MANYVDVNAKVTYAPAGGGIRITLETTDSTLDDVTSGDLVIAGALVGVAVADYNADTDTVVIDTMGCYKLSVIGKDNGGSSCAIALGDWLYYDPVADQVNRDYINGICIGQALEAVGSGLTATIGVKLMPIPWSDCLAMVAAAVA